MTIRLRLVHVALLAMLVAISGCDQASWYIDYGEPGKSLFGEYVTSGDDGSIYVMARRSDEAPPDSGLSRLRSARLFKYSASGIRVWTSDLPFPSPANVTRGLTVTDDGGIFALATDFDNTFRDHYYLTRFDADGTMLNQVEIYEEGLDSYYLDLFPDGDGGVFVTTFTVRAENGTEYNAVDRFHADGSFVERIVLDFAGLRRVGRNDEGGYIGATSREVYLFDDAWQVVTTYPLWRPLLDDGFRFFARDIRPLVGGGYIVGGLGRVLGEEDTRNFPALVRLDESGVIQWWRGFTELRPFGQAMLASVDAGKLAFVGQAYDPASEGEPFAPTGIRVHLLDYAGIELGLQTYWRHAEFRPIHAAADGEYLIVTGFTRPKYAGLDRERLYLQRSLPLQPLWP